MRILAVDSEDRARLLVDKEDSGLGFVVDTSQGVQFPDALLVALIARGDWIDYDGSQSPSQILLGTSVRKSVPPLGNDDAILLAKGQPG